MIFLQKPDRPIAKPFLWQAGSHDSFAKPDRPHVKPFLWQARAMIFLQKLTVCKLPFLWQAGSYDIFAKNEN
jgi:hypothetical protein